MSVLSLRKPLDPNAPPVLGTLSPRLMWLFWAPLAVTAAGAVAGWDFVYFAFASALALNGKILIVMLWGSLVMFLQMRVAYREDRAFHSGIDWLRKGAWSSQPNPKLGPPAFVQGMLERLEKLGLGHQVYVQSAAMEPELEALENHFRKRQELSNFLVGLMVGLGLLGTFIGLLQTLIATSELIGSISKAVGGGGGNMEAEFGKIVGGLQKPLESMGTAFSASMFGLIGSIMLGFQTVVVNKTVAQLVDNVRETVLSLAEKSKDGAHVEITERYLATLLGDMMEQHRAAEERLAAVALKLTELTPQVAEAARSSQQLAGALGDSRVALTQAGDGLGAVQGALGQVLPAMGELSQLSAESLREAVRARAGVEAVVSHLPDQAELSRQLRDTMRDLDGLRQELRQSRTEGDALAREIREQSAVLKRLDALLYQTLQDDLRRALSASPDAGRA
jgi:hypothetical protein